MQAKLGSRIDRLTSAHQPYPLQARCSLVISTRQHATSNPDLKNVSTGGLFLPDEGISEYVREDKKTYASPSITSTGTLRPSAEWYPSWMKYRRREDNYVFWQDKFSRNSLDISPAEKRWTLFGTVWYLVMQTRFYAIPPALRYIVYLAWRSVMFAVYDLHKKIVIAQCKLDVQLAAKALGLQAPSGRPKTQTQAAPSTQQASASSTQETASSSSQQQESPENSQGSDSQASTSGTQEGNEQQTIKAPSFSLTMALRRLHWKNTLLAEIMYLINVHKTGRINMLPPTKKPLQRPTFFWLF